MTPPKNDAGTAGAKGTMIYTGFYNGILIVGSGVIASLLLVAVVRRCFSEQVLKNAHDTTGHLLAVVGTLYAVMLGLVVVDSMVRFEKAIDVTQAESTSLADIFLLAERLPEPFRQRIHQGCRDYAVAVVEKEWPLMADGFVSIDARQAGLRLLRTIDGFEPTTESEKAIFPLLLQEMQAAWNHRRERITTAQYGLPTVEWAALLIGAIVTILFAGLFSVENVRLHALITAMAALVIGLNLYLVSLFAYPYSGDLVVSSQPFRIDIGVFDGIYDELPAHGGERSKATR
jgi:hypothetical protein